MKYVTWVPFLASLLSIGIACADTPGKELHATGTIVSVTPPPPDEAKKLVVKTDAGNVEYVISEAAVMAPGLKSGDQVTVEYTDSSGIHWADTVKKVASKGGEGKKKRKPD
jgi:hypothetical protein